MSQQPSPRVKPRSTLAKTGSRCDVALVLMAVTSEVRRRSGLEALAGHDAHCAAPIAVENATCRPLRAARTEHFRLRTVGVNAARQWFLRICPVRRIPVKWKKPCNLRRAEHVDGRCGLLR